MARRIVREAVLWRVGPAGEVQGNRAIILGMKFLLDGRESAQEQIGGVGHDGGAAGADLVVGLEFVEFSEGAIDVDSRAEFDGITDELGGDVDLIELALVHSGVLDAEAGVRFGDDHAAATAAGGAMPTVELGRVQGQGRARRLRIHVSSFLVERRRSRPNSRRGRTILGIVGMHPAVFVRVASKGVTGYGK